MSGILGVRDVVPGELLARFILRGKYIRPDGTLTPNPFIPYRHVELSVTRHIGLSELDIWRIGASVARAQQETLFGRGDVTAIVFSGHALKVQPDPLEDNPNHANVVGWPPDKQSQKEIALKIVKKVSYVKKKDV